ncbi:MAG: Holliday junction resolvase RuvX [Saprospiraceae bacterium]|nr:Holliday junction resolvase RuvX [Saprospiraceae bacterium]
MARILSIDYGLKRCGIATTDPLQLIVTGLTTVETSNLFSFLENYFKDENVEKMVVGLPVHKDGNFTYLKHNIDIFTTLFSKKWPSVIIDYADEQFSSQHAKQIIKDGGAKKKTRQDKSLVDKISAVIILQRYLKHI